MNAGESSRCTNPSHVRKLIGVLFFRGDDAVATTALKRQRELRVMDRGGI